MQKFLSLLAIVGLLTLSTGCSHTTKKYYDDDRRIDVHHDGDGHRHDDYHHRHE